MKETKRAAKKLVKEVPIVEVLQALADPVRLEIVRQLDLDGEKPCGSFGIDRPKSSMSHHFGILRKAGVLSFEKKGALLMNRVERDHLDANYPGILDSVLAVAQRETKTSRKSKNKI